MTVTQTRRQTDKTNINMIYILDRGQHGTGNVKMDKLIRYLVECHSQIHIYISMEIIVGSGNLIFGQGFV